MRHVHYFLLVFLIASTSCLGQKENQEKEYFKTYTNPVVGYSLPDPTIVRSDDGKFYLYATEDIRNVPIHQSQDLVNWELTGTAFTDSTRPTFEPNGGIWAPEIQFINDQYVMYYSNSVWGGEWTCGIGIATSDSPMGPFHDYGKLFRSNEIGVQNSIDPFYIEEDNRKYLFWGSFSGLFAVELGKDGLSIMENAEIIQVAGKAYEATYILARNGYYYFFASIGTCCEGVNSTYTTVVGRAENLMGPYLNKNGQSMMENHHEVLIKGNERFVGTGHNANIITDDRGNDWILYHAVDKTNPKGRVLMLDQLHWQDEWPYVKNQSPSTRDVPAPVFN